MKKGAPTSIADILRAHREVCDKTVAVLENSKDDKLLPLCRAVATLFDRSITQEQHDACSLDPKYGPGSDRGYEHGAQGDLSSIKSLITLRERCQSHHRLPW